MSTNPEPRDLTLVLSREEYELLYSAAESHGLDLLVGERHVAILSLLSELDSRVGDDRPFSEPEKTPMSKLNEKLAGLQEFEPVGEALNDLLARFQSDTSWRQRRGEFSGLGNGTLKRLRAFALLFELDAALLTDWLYDVAGDLPPGSFQKPPNPT